MKTESKKVVLTATLLWLRSGAAWAATGAASLPWESPLTTVARSLTGPVAFAVSLIALAATGGTLIFNGGQLGEFGHRVCYAVLAISFLVAGSSFLAILFGVGGAVV